MLKKIFVSLIVLFMDASTAQACSVWYENRKNEFQYDHLSPTIYDRDWTPFDDNALIGLAKGQVPFIWQKLKSERLAFKFPIMASFQLVSLNFRSLKH